MLAKGQRPIIGRLSELLVSRCRPAFLDMGGGATSPTNHFDLNLMLSPSPRGNNLRNYNGGGVGLGIVAALDNSSAIFGREILVKHAVCSPKANSGRAIQIPGISSSADEEEIENMEEENYTYVTTRGPHRSSTRVYYEGGVNNQSGVVGRAAVCGDSYSFQISPPTPAAPENPTPGFLRSCHSCRKNLDGNDIYMYSEKAFCSPECRSKEIRKDEKKERCGSEAVTRSTVVSESPIFSTGILAI